MRQISVRGGVLLLSASLFTVLTGFVRADEPKTAKELVGVWNAVSAVEANRDDPFDGELRDATFVITEKNLIIVPRDTNVSKGQLVVIPQEKGASHVDFEWKGQKVQGIYRVKDNNLTLCFDRSGKERP